MAQSAAAHKISLQMDFQHFLDENEYSWDNIGNHEKVFKQYFPSTGGEETVKEFVNSLSLSSNDYVLDFGCGTGQSAIYMAEKFDANVLGIDISSNMILKANCNLHECSENIRNKVEFLHTDLKMIHFGRDTFNCIYVREVLDNFLNKEAFLSKFWKWLKPDGKLFLNEYCFRRKELWELVNESCNINYSHSRRSLVTLQDFIIMIKKAGFRTIIAKDKERQGKKLLEAEVQYLKDEKHEIMTRVPSDVYETIFYRCESKLQRFIHGNETWVIIHAQK